MNKLTVQDVQKSFTDYVALVKQTCKTEKEIQDLKNIMTTNDKKMIETMAKHQEYIAKNEKLNNENKQLNNEKKKLNEELDAINNRLFSEKNPIKKQWNASTHITDQGSSRTTNTKITPSIKTNKGGTRRRKNIKQYRAHKRRTHKRTKR